MRGRDLALRANVLGIDGYVIWGAALFPKSLGIRFIAEFSKFAFTSFVLASRLIRVTSNRRCEQLDGRHLGDVI